MQIGYACLIVGEPIKHRTCRLENATDENLIQIIAHNLDCLEKMLEYNIKNDIKMLRITSDIIPLASHSSNKLKWWEIFETRIKVIGDMAMKFGIRLSMHPGQYTVLNSLNEEVVLKSIEDLRFHTRFLDSLGIDSTNKIILHIGGAYGDKKSALERFAVNYKRLDENIKKRLVIENDDKIFTIKEVLLLGIENKIPVVYDNLHNQVNPSDNLTDFEWIQKANKTWGENDGVQKIHYSQQDKDKKPGAHSPTIYLDDFIKFAKEVEENALDVDIMLEVKDKNLSAKKAVNALNESSIKELELEWARYKYLVLEHSNKIYNDIRQLLKKKENYPVLEFYNLIDSALSTAPTVGSTINALEHVWGYFKADSNDKTKIRFQKEIDKILNSNLQDLEKLVNSAKRILLKLAIEKGEDYLLNSLYFKSII